LRQGRVPAEPGHQTSYIARRVLGAMIDAIRASYKHDVNLSDSANYEQVDLGPQPDRAYQIKQAMQALFAKNPRAGHVVVQLVSGYACQDVAKEFSVSGATISHLRAHARNITERFL
jgi:DNA-binding CsgD family transcriptional regulator